jgi:hypothetical protein
MCCFYSDYEFIKFSPFLLFSFFFYFSKMKILSSPSSLLPLISIFDNAGHGAEGPINLDDDISLGKYIELNHLTRTATLLRSFASPESPLAAFSQGSLQTLPNGNVLINWGSERAITELDNNGTHLFHAFLDSGF